MCVYQEKEKNGLKSESTGLKRARERGERAKERERERERRRKEGEIKLYNTSKRIVIEKTHYNT
jgi:hypothetical protein